MKRYSELYKREIVGDDCCGFWRIKNGGTCVGWPYEKEHECPANEDGTGCPLFPGKARNLTLDPSPLLSMEYWDCECAGKYIHKRSVEMCSVCGAVRDTMPNSRKDEVAEGTHFA